MTSGAIKLGVPIKSDLANASFDSGPVISERKYMKLRFWHKWSFGKVSQESGCRRCVLQGGYYACVHMHIIRIKDKL